MPKWSKDATRFTVSVTYHETRGAQVYIPKPVIEDKLGKPNSLTFIVKGNKIEVARGSDREKDIEGN